MADTEKPVLPPTPPLYPTKTRLKLARAIASKPGVKHWHFIRPETRDLSTETTVTARVKELVLAGLATYGERNGFNTSIVSLTPAGEEWLKTYGGTE